MLIQNRLKRDENPVGTWTLRVKDKQNNGKTGTFEKWSMHLWGSAIDAAKATPYQLPDNWDYPPLPPMPSKTVAPSTTKTFAKPTAHLPGDHAEAEGEAHKPFGDHPTSAPVPSPTEQSSGHELQKPGYLAGIKSLAGQSPTWLFVAAGTVVVFIAGVSAFFVIRRRKGRRRAGRGGGDYDFAPTTDEEDHPMSSLGRGGIHLSGANNGTGTGRTKDLYDAFALHDSEDDESDGDFDRVDDERARLRPEAYESSEKVIHPFPVKETEVLTNNLRQSPYADVDESEADQAEHRPRDSSEGEDRLLGSSSPPEGPRHLD